MLLYSHMNRNMQIQTHKPAPITEFQGFTDSRFDSEPSFSPIGSVDRKFQDREEAFSTSANAQEIFAQPREQRIQRGFGQFALKEGAHVKLIDASEAYVIPVRNRNTPPLHRADGEAQ